MSKRLLIILSAVFLLSILIAIFGFYLWSKDNLRWHIKTARTEVRLINFRNVLPEESWLFHEQKQREWEEKLSQASIAISQGDKQKVKTALQAIKERIELFSIADRRNLSVDKDQNGISDYMDNLYKEIIFILNKLK